MIVQSTGGKGSGNDEDGCGVGSHDRRGKDGVSWLGTRITRSSRRWAYGPRARGGCAVDVDAEARTNLPLRRGAVPRLFVEAGRSCDRDRWPCQALPLRGVREIPDRRRSHPDGTGAPDRGSQDRGSAAGEDGPFGGQGGGRGTEARPDPASRGRSRRHVRLEP